MSLDWPGNCCLAHVISSWSIILSRRTKLLVKKTIDQIRSEEWELLFKYILPLHIMYNFYDANSGINNCWNNSLPDWIQNQRWCPEVRMYIREALDSSIQTMMFYLIACLRMTLKGCRKLNCLLSPWIVFLMSLVTRGREHADSSNLDCISV